MQNLNKTVAKATKWSIVTEIISKIISPIVNMVLARLLQPEAFGAIATITMIISFAEIFTDAGFQKYIIQHEFKDIEDFDISVNVAFWSNLMLSISFVIIIYIFKAQIATLVYAPELSNGIAIASLSIICMAFSSIQMAVYRRNFEFKKLFYIRMVTSLIPIFITVPLAYFFRNYWALICGTLCMNFVQAVILTIKSDWKPRLVYCAEKLKEMFSFTAWTLLETLSIWLTSYIGTFIVGRELNDYYLGIYKTSMTTVNSYMGIIIYGITPVLFSTLSRYQNDNIKFKETYFNFQKVVGIFLIPMGLGIYIFRDLAVSILLGSQWTEASDFIGLWGLTSALTIVFSNFTSEVYRSKGKPKISLFLQLLHLAFVIPSICLSLKYGFEILCVVRSIVRIQGIICGLIVVHILFDIKITETLKNVLPQVISSAIMGLIAISIRDIFESIIWKFFAIGICVIVYGVCLLQFAEIKSLLKNKNWEKKYDKRI